MVDLDRVTAGRDFSARIGDHTEIGTVHHHWHSPPPPVPVQVRGLVVGAIPHLAPYFVSRAQIEQVHHALGRQRVAVVVCGMRGAGKTQVAAAYARKAMTDPDIGLVGWIGAETRDSALAGLAEIADSLGVADPTGDSLVSARRLRNHLNSSPELSGLLVFDNATDPDFLPEFLPTTGEVRVVITSTERGFTGLGALVDAATGSSDRNRSATCTPRPGSMTRPAPTTWPRRWGICRWPWPRPRPPSPPAVWTTPGTRICCPLNRFRPCYRVSRVVDIPSRWIRRWG
ncbi:hypothetical protein AB0H71_31885 [Nocardia sp. NPDC050697]|uniref:hypothetical protein n=1 Tax=Nocardia sp. NPDC050697 TaxID=3155158 RepID=UPI0033E876B7